MKIAFLIERPQEAHQGAPIFWGIEEGEPGWTYDHQWATRFETREEADKHASDIGIPDYIVVEHAWQ